MTELSIQTIIRGLPEHCRNIFIGYSGGIDSHVLLHLCASQAEIKDKLVAVYIHHGLQQAADAWETHCRQQSQNLAVDFKMIKVDATAKVGESPEEAARNARYAALQGLLQPGDVLLLGQHREDQMETLLLQLLRGSGIQGLGAMPVSMVFGEGLMLRPLLNIAKQEIQQYAGQHGLQWVDDPSNQSSDFDRNYLRNQVIPLLKQRWPAADKTVARAAQHCANAAQLLNEWAEQSLSEMLDPLDRSLPIDQWLQFSEQRRYWLLRQWLQIFGLKPPSLAILQTIIDQVVHAKMDANPEVRIQGRYVRKYRQKLFCLDGEHLRKETDVKQWAAQEMELGMSNGYILKLLEAPSGIDKRLWHAQNVTVACRRGGEKIKLFGREGHHCLKKLYQEAGIPPWERDIRPLIYLNGRLAAIAGLWVDEWAWCQQGECYRLSWQPCTV